MAFAVAAFMALSGAPSPAMAQTVVSVFADYGLANGIRVQRGRFTVIADARDERLAQSLLDGALANDSFPGLPKPKLAVLIAIAPDGARFSQWVGASAPEWGAAIAFPDQQRIVMQGSRAGGDAGNPLVVLRHELAHLALHEIMGNLPTRWFDEGYASVAAGEWNRESAFETSVTLVWRTLPSLDQLERGFAGGASEAQWSYALAHRVVSELESLDATNGLTNFFAYWKETRSFERAIRDAFGLTSTQFDRYWHMRTRQRFGALAVIGNLSLIIGVFGVLLGPLFWMRRQRDKRRLEVMRAADVAQERALRASMLEVLLAVRTENEEKASGSAVNPCSDTGNSDILPS